MIQLPHWIKNEPDDRVRSILENRFRLRLAALYACPEGTLESLANIIGVHPKTLCSQAQSIVQASKATRSGIRSILGDEFVPPEMPAYHRNNR